MAELKNVGQGTQDCAGNARAVFWVLCMSFPHVKVRRAIVDISIYIYIYMSSMSSIYLEAACLEELPNAGIVRGDTLFGSIDPYRLSIAGTCFFQHVQRPTTEPVVNLLHSLALAARA